MHREAQVVCVLIPRFTLLTAVGRARATCCRTARPALAPEPDREQVVGEVSGAAEAHGIHPGMRLGEALARCPGLRLVPPDPERAASMWEAVLAALEGIGAAVEPAAPGEAYFDAAALRRMYGGHLEGVLARVRKAVRMPARLGAAPSRFCAFAAATRARPGRGSKIVPAGAERAFLAPLPVSLLPAPLAAELCPALERLGVRTLGELAALPARDVADRFGVPGLRARELAGGHDEPLRPRPPGEVLSEEIELPEAVSGIQLQRALELLIDRLLARPERRERALRRMRLGARFVERGTWRREVALRQATTSRERLRLALSSRLERAARSDRAAVPDRRLLRPAGRRPALVPPSRRGAPPPARGGAAPDPRGRRRRVGAARARHRSGSRVPERRAFLTPFPE